MPRLLLDAIESAANHVRRQGVAVDLSLNEPPGAATIRAARQACPLALPEQLVDVYREIGDGFAMRWAAHEDRGPFGMIDLLPLQPLADNCAGRRKFAREWDDAYDFRFTKDPRLARRTAMRMRSWLQFHAEGNGDGFCLEVGEEGAPVVYHQHDWFDCGSGDNGHVVGHLLHDFLMEWARRCFQRPRELWWAAVVGKGGIDWSNREFDSRFVV